MILELIKNRLNKESRAAIVATQRDAHINTTTAMPCPFNSDSRDMTTHAHIHELRQVCGFKGVGTESGNPSKLEELLGASEAGVPVVAANLRAIKQGCGNLHAQGKEIVCTLCDPNTLSNSNTSQLG